MKTRGLCLMVVILVVVFLGGCSLNKQFVDRMASPASMLFPDLRKAYRGEPLELSEEQRARRLRLLDEWEKTIKEAEKATK